MVKVLSGRISGGLVESHIGHLDWCMLLRCVWQLGQMNPSALAVAASRFCADCSASRIFGSLVRVVVGVCHVCLGNDLWLEVRRLSW